MLETNPYAKDVSLGTRMRRCRMSRAARLLGLSLVLVLAGCDGKDQGQASSTTAPPDSAARTEIDRLRALGYVGYVEGSEADDRQGVVKFDREHSCPGYTLYSVFRLASVYLIDAEGNVVHSWSDPSGFHWARCKLLPNGNLLVVGSSITKEDQRVIDDEGRYVALLSWNGETIWRKPLPGHHDIELTPQNQFALLTYRYRQVPEVNEEVPLRDEEIMILSRDGDELERHSIYDMLNADPAVYTFQKVKVGKYKGKPGVQLFHSNTLERMRHRHLESRDPIYAAGNVLISMRHQDAIAIVNLETDKVMWAWGHGKIRGPHSATVLENGNILLFDNGLGRKWSRVIELDPLTKRIVWEYKAPKPGDFYSATRGANQRLPNGNTLITNSDHGQVFEVTPDGEIVWEFLAPHFNEKGQRATIVQAHRHETQFVQAMLEQFADDHE